jgi:hypothetical protein
MLTVTAAEGTLANRTVAQIVWRLLSQNGGIPEDAISNITQLDAQAPQEVGFWVGDETTIGPTIDRILDSVNAFLTETRDGTFILGQLVNPTVGAAIANFQPWMVKDVNGVVLQGANDPGTGIRISADINDATSPTPVYLNNQDATVGLPVWRVLMQYASNYTQMSGADIAGASLADITFVMWDYRTLSVDNGVNGPIRTMHAKSPEFTCVTQLIGGSPIVIALDGLDLISDTSSTSLSIDNTSQTLTVSASMGYEADQTVYIVTQDDPYVYMGGTVTSYSGTTLVVNVTVINGSGTYTEWDVYANSAVVPQDAYNEAVRQLALHGFADDGLPRMVIQLPIDTLNPRINAASVQLGSVFTYQQPGLPGSFPTGKPFFCIGMAENYGDHQTACLTTLYGWG